MSKKKINPEKRFEIHLGENLLTITTNRAETRIKIIEMVIQQLLYEYERKRPEELDSFMGILNFRYEVVKGMH